MMTSINFQIADKRWDNKTKMSSQSAFFTQKMLRAMVKAKCDYAVLEVTSHAITQSRIYGINFDVAAYTNISNDHLEYHGSFEKYLRTKASFLSSVQGMRRKVGVDKVLVLNADDDQFEYMNQFQANRKYTFGFRNGSIKVNGFELYPDRSKFTIEAPNASFEVELLLIGDFNIYNALTATAIVLSQGLTPEQIKKGFDSMRPIAGRYEPLQFGQPYAVIVDYAHTEDALAKLCSIFNSVTKGKTILVFGCTGGGRDKAKRPKMGAIADKLADEIVLTNDDPYNENQLQIIEDIAVGINRKEGERLAKIVDRRTAIEYALEIAQPEDTVLIAGKGCEQVIAIGDKLVPWDDRKVVREILEREHVVNL